MECMDGISSLNFQYIHNFARFSLQLSGIAVPTDIPAGWSGGPSGMGEPGRGL